MYYSTYIEIPRIDNFIESENGVEIARLLCPRGFSRQEYRSGFSCLPLGDLPNPGIKPRSPILQADFLPSEPPGTPGKREVMRCYWE